jgi:hypothetical protein
MMKTDLVAVISNQDLKYRECYSCGSNETYIDRKGVHHWYGNGNGTVNQFFAQNVKRNTTRTRNISL